MIATVLQSDRPVGLVGGGRLSEGDLRDVVLRCDVLAAADGGAEALVAAGITPAAVIGDMDSLSESLRQALPSGRVHAIAEQDSTDFEKCLDRIDAPLILGAGFLDGRMDHGLAAMSVLIGHARACILLGEEDLVFHAGRAVELELPVGSRLSLFPMQPVSGQSEGLEWPIAGLALRPGGRIATSNRVRGRVRLRFDGDGMLVILPRAALDSACAALLDRGG